MSSGITVRSVLATRIDLRRWARAFGLSLLVWTLAWALYSSQGYVYSRSKGLPVPWFRFLGTFVEFAVLALLTPSILDFVRRKPLGRLTWRGRLPLHVLMGLAVSALAIAPMQLGRLALSLALREPELYMPLTSGIFARWLVSILFMYIDVALLGHALYYSRESRAKEVETSRLQAQLAQAQLDVLRMQLHPHFLFNTLHSISALMHRDVGAADRMITRLADLLRLSLERVTAQVVSLKQELEFLDGFLEIEKTRFLDRLTVKLDIDPEALDAEVPNLLLQPLVENAIRHGISRRSGPGRIEVKARRQNNMVVLQIRDNGPGIPLTAELALRSGVGLANTQARLRQLYGDGHRFELRNHEGGGLEVTLAFPLRWHGESSPPPPPSSSPPSRVSLEEHDGKPGLADALRP